MNSFVLLFIMLQPNGELTTRADNKMHMGADLCLSQQEKLNEDLGALKKRRVILDFSTQCIDTHMIPGVPA